MGVVPGGLVPESRQALTNIRAVLEANGLSLQDVVKCTVMLADIGEWGQFNEVYKEFFSAPFPTRSAFGTSGLALGARVELECMAVFP
jgi:2-iminobutanoate/2-iminopropanoate deaminase